MSRTSSERLTYVQVTSCIYGESYTILIFVILMYIKFYKHIHFYNMSFTSLALSLGSSFLYTGVMPESFKVSGNFLLYKVFVNHVVGQGFHNFSDSSLRKTFKGEFSIYLKLLLSFKDARMVWKTINNSLYFISSIS